jgi:transposase
MSAAGKTTDQASVAARRRKAVWLTEHGWKGPEIAREICVSRRTIVRYRSHARRAAEAVTAR